MIRDYRNQSNRMFVRPAREDVGTRRNPVQEGVAVSDVKPPPDHVPPDHVPPENEASEPEAEPQDRNGGVAENLLSRSSWLRVLFMVLFIAIWGISRFIIFAVIILQVLFLLFTGGRNDRLALFGQSLAVYSQQLVAYLTFASEDQPFPFNEWPGG